MTDLKTPSSVPVKKHSFRRAMFRGMGVVMPPLLTVVILLWIWNTVQLYVLEPVLGMVNQAIVWNIAEVHKDLPQGAVAAPSVGANAFEVDGKKYYRLPNQRYVPWEVHQQVQQSVKNGTLPENETELYRLFVQQQYLKPYIVVPIFLVIFILAMFLLGRFIAAGIGRMLWGWTEKVIFALPLIRNIYSSVKQVTDFMLSEQELEYTRIVAVEYPRRGIWSLGFVTSESMIEIRNAAKEPVLAVLIPSSPMPVTGYTITVPRKDIIDLNITIDQALQYIISCGVVVPPHQMASMVKKENGGGKLEKMTLPTT